MKTRRTHAAKTEDELKDTGGGADWKIMTGEKPDIVEETAAFELKKILNKGLLEAVRISENTASLSGKLILGTIKSSETIRRLVEKGEIRIGEVSVNDDGFHLKRAGSDIVIAGANPRGVLYAVYRFEDWLRGDRADDKSLDIFEVPYFRTRHIPGMLYDQEAIRYLSRLRVNSSTSAHSLLPFSMHSYVSSDVFPGIIDENTRAQYRAELRGTIERCRRYGIELFPWFMEPVALLMKNTPRVGWWKTGITNGDVFPKEVIGISRWHRSMDTYSLCVNHPKVQAHYADMIKRFVSDFPEVKSILVYQNDTGSCLCDSSLCPCCKKLGIKPLGYVENHVTFMRILQKAANEVNPQFTVFVGPWHFDRYDRETAELLLQGKEIPPGSQDSLQYMLQNMDIHSGLLSTSFMSDGHLAFNHEVPAFKRAMDTCRKRGVTMGFVDLFLGCDEFWPPTGGGFPAPFNAWDKLQTYRKYGRDVIWDESGHGAPVTILDINELIWKEGAWNPNQDKEQTVKRIAVRQFGQIAGEKMYLAWKELGKVVSLWGDPVCRVSYFERLFHYLEAGNKMYDTLSARAEESRKLFSKPENWKTALLFRENLKLMQEHYEKAASLMTEAINLASEREYPYYCYYEPEKERNCKSYAQQLYNQVKIIQWIHKHQYYVLCAVEILVKIDQAQGNEDETAILRENLKQLEQKELISTESVIPFVESLIKLQPRLMDKSLPTECYDPKKRSGYDHKGIMLVNFYTPDHVLDNLKEHVRKIKDLNIAP